MAQLRRKLEADPARPRHLLTEPGMGYRFQPNHNQGHQGGGGGWREAGRWRSGRPARGAAAPPNEKGPVELVAPAAVAAIRAGRPAGYPVGGIDLSSHDHQRFTIRWPTEVAAGSRFVYVKATEGTTYLNPHFAADYAAAQAMHRHVGRLRSPAPTGEIRSARPNISCATRGSPATHRPWCRSSTWNGLTPACAPTRVTT